MSGMDPDSVLSEAMLDRGADVDPVPDEPDEETRYRPAEFDPKHRESFTGLLYVGALTSTEQVFGHEFVISTPTQTERMQMGQVVQPYVDTVSGNIAWTTAYVAAFLVSVDGHELPQPILNNAKDTALIHRFKWVHENLRKPVVDELYSRCMALDLQVDQVLEAMGKA